MMSRRSPDSAWLGVDLGTQSVRAMLVSETGEVLGVGSQKLTSHRDGPRHEQNPEEWWTATSIACRTALVALPGGCNVDGWLSWAVAQHAHRRAGA